MNLLQLLRWFFVAVILAVVLALVNEKTQGASLCAQDAENVMQTPITFCGQLECGGFWFYFWDCPMPEGGCQ